ncbi:MAG: universal stress protein [Arenicella sp.]
MFKKILMPIDLQETELTEKTVEIAIYEARKHGAELHVLTVVQGFGMPLVATFFPENVMKHALKEVAKELKKFTAETIPDDIKAHPIISQGVPAEQVLSQANQLEVDLIVIPSHAQSSKEVMLLGSCAGRVVEHASCSVMVVKA